MPIAVDFTQVSSLEPLPEGQYLAKVVHAEEGLSANQQPKIEMRWEIIAPELTSEGKPASGRQVFDILSFHPDAMFRTKDVLKGMGFDENFTGEISAEVMIGKECAINLKIEQSTQTDEDGNPYPPRNKVRKVRPAEKFNSSGSAMAALSEPVVVESKPRRNK